MSSAIDVYQYERRKCGMMDETDGHRLWTKDVLSFSCDNIPTVRELQIRDDDRSKKPDVTTRPWILFRMTLCHVILSHEINNFINER